MSRSGIDAAARGPLSGDDSRSAENGSPPTGRDAADGRTLPGQGGVAQPPMPRAAVRALLSVAVVVHLLAIGVSLLAIIEPSATHERLLDSFRPYLQATHFGLDDRPLYLADGSPQEQALRLQVADTAEPTEADWRTIRPDAWPGLAASDRWHRWLATAAMLAESEQPSLAAELLLPVALQHETATAVRIERLPATWRVGASDGPPLPYTARVVRHGNQVSLVQLQAPRLNAPTVDADSEANDG